MKENFTQKVLIKKLYNETEKFEEAMLAEAMKDDFSLQEDLEDFAFIKEQLRGERYFPSKTSIKIIMDYSRKTSALGLLVRIELIHKNQK